MDTGRDAASGAVVSRLSLAGAVAADTGNYTCSLTSLPEDPGDRHGLTDTIAVHVLQGENTEAIYSRGERLIPVLWILWLLGGGFISFAWNGRQLAGL